MKINFEKTALFMILFALLTPTLFFVIMIVASIPKEVKSEKVINLGQIESTAIPNPESRYPDIQLNCSNGRWIRLPLRYNKYCLKGTSVSIVYKYTLLQRTMYYKVGVYLIPISTGYRFIHWRKIPKQQQEPTYPLRTHT